MRVEIFAVVTKPPDESGVTIFSTVTSLPSTTKLTSEGGLLLDVVQLSVTLSPAFASRSPVIITCDGGSRNLK